MRTECREYLDQRKRNWLEAGDDYIMNLYTSLLGWQGEGL